MQSELLIATNGYEGTLPAIDYGAWLASVLHLKVTVLGVTEKPNPAAIDDHHPLADVFARAVKLLEQNQVEYKLEVQKGNAEDVIPNRARQGDFINVIGPLGRPQIRRLISRRSFRHLMEEIEQPILYVPVAKFPPKRILISIGGLGYEVDAEHIAMKIAMKTNAEIILLHIIPPVALNYPTAITVSEHWQTIAETDTPAGRSLREALDAAKNNGLTANVKPRRGDVVEEILAEIKEGDYDLLCMGSLYSSKSLRQLYSPNVTAEIADGIQIPVLTARYSSE